MAKNVIIGQSGGPTAVINSSLAGVYKAACSLGADKVYGMKYGIEGLLKEELVELNILLDDRLSIELLKRTPSSYLGSCRYKLPEPEADSTPYVKLFTLFDKYDICAVFYIGGNDSMDTIAKLSRYGAQVGSAVRFIGVPKTIDNDLCLTDHTPGYGSAAKYIATILKEVIRDSSVYDIRSVTVAEIMGRHAGWLAGAACLAGGDDSDGPDLILLPEVPFEQDKFLARVDELQRVKSNVIIAASEGVKTADGTYLCDLVSTAGQLDAFGHKAILSGTSRYLSDLIHDKLNCKSRAIEFSTLQRCASHLASRTDVTEAYAVGGAAAAAAFAGETGKMIALKRVSEYPYQCITEAVDVQQVANLEKKVSGAHPVLPGEGIVSVPVRPPGPLLAGHPFKCTVRSDRDGGAGGIRPCGLRGGRDRLGHERSPGFPRHSRGFCRKRRKTPGSAPAGVVGDGDGRDRKDPRCAASGDQRWKWNPHRQSLRRV